MAARNGREEAVFYLLAKGFPVSPIDVEAAVWYGNPTIVQVFLEWDPFKYIRSFETVVNKENEKVLRMLLDPDLSRDDLLYKESLVEQAREQGLESMEKLLLEYFEG